MNDLHVVIKMQGHAWGSGPFEKDYQELCELVSRIISQDIRFVDVGKTVDVRIKGFPPVTRGIFINKPIKNDEKVQITESRAG